MRAAVDPELYRISPSLRPLVEGWPDRTSYDDALGGAALLSLFGCAALLMRIDPKIDRIHLLRVGEAWTPFPDFNGPDGAPIAIADRGASGRCIRPVDFHPAYPPARSASTIALWLDQKPGAPVEELLFETPTELEYDRAAWMFDPRLRVRINADLDLRLVAHEVAHALVPSNRAHDRDWLDTFAELWALMPRDEILDLLDLTRR